jgi:hypothetical protein
MYACTYEYMQAHVFRLWSIYGLCQQLRPYSVCAVHWPSVTYIFVQKRQRSFTNTQSDSFCLFQHQGLNSKQNFEICS